MKLESRNAKRDNVLLEIEHIKDNQTDSMCAGQEKQVLPPRMVVRLMDIQSISIAERGNVHYLFLRSGAIMVITFTVAMYLRDLLVEANELTLSVADGRAVRTQRYNPPSNTRQRLLWLILFVLIATLIVMPGIPLIVMHPDLLISVGVGLFILFLITYKISDYFTQV